MTLPFRHHPRPWTEEEKQVLAAMYPHAPTPLVAKTMLRSVKSIYSQAHVMGIEKSEAYMKALAEKYRKLYQHD